MSSQLTPEEQAYRRGFDQAIAFLLMDLGLTNKQIQDLFYKKKVGWWRHGRVLYSFKSPDPAPRMDGKEQTEIAKLLLEVFQEQHQEEAA